MDEYKNENTKIDVAKLASLIARFINFVQYKDNKNGTISFRDNKGYLGSQEDYKSKIAQAAREELKCNLWKESWVGTGKIAECVKKAMIKSDNLVNVNQRIDFINRLDSNRKQYQPNAEKVLYDIYANPLCDESKAFEEAIETFGVKYDTIAFLFFIKDDTRFLPISTGHFDLAFKILNIGYKTNKRCSWNNYQGFINIIKQIRVVLENTLPMDSIPRLIDAHSFVWIIQGQDFNEWNPHDEEKHLIETQAEEIIQNEVSGSGGRKQVLSNVYKRSKEVVNETKRRAKGVCQLCNMPAPFNDKNGEPYLEVHHIVWLSRGGEDSTTNTVALCPNCHTRMHVVEDANDVERLLKIAMNK